MKKQSKKASHKERILRSAIRLFQEEGFYNVLIEDIVKASNSSTGSIYNYFSSKDELVILYRQEVLGTCRSFYDRLQTDAAYAGKNALEKLRALVGHVLELLSLVGEEFGRVFTVHRLKETDAVPEDKPYLALIEVLVEAGQKDGSIRSDYSTGDIAGMVDLLITGCYIEWQVKRGRYTILEKKAAAINMLFNHISSAATKHKPKEMFFAEIWADTVSRTSRDFSSDIKRLEEQWLERFYDRK